MIVPGSALELEVELMPLNVTGFVTELLSFKHSRFVAEEVEEPSAVKVRADCVVLAWAIHVIRSLLE